MSRSRLSITSLFTLATLLPLVLAGLALLGLAISATHRSSAALGRDILEETSRRVEEDVSGYLDHTRRLSDLLSGILAESDLSDAFWTQWAQRMFVYLRTTPEVGSICFTSEALDTGYLMRYPPALEYGRARGQGDGSQLSTFEAHLDGTIAPEPRKVYDYDPRTRIWWQLGHSSDAPHWTAPYQWFQSPERLKESTLAIAYTRTVRDSAGKRLGVLSIDATLDQINQHLHRITRLPGAFIIVTDARKQLIATSLDGVLSDLEPRQDLNNKLASTVRDASHLVDGLRGQDARFAQVSVGTQRYWVRQVPLSIERGPNWVMTLAIPDDQLLESSKSAVRWMTLAGSFCLAASILFAIVLARRVTHPLRDLAGFAKEIGAGRFEHRTPAGSTREVDELSQALNHMAASLEERVQLLAQKDAAQEATAMKSRLIAHVSHEFRTPLNAIMGYAEMLREKCHAYGRIEDGADADRILLASRHLLALVNNLLDLSRVEAGKMTIDRVEFDIHRIVEEVSDTVRPVVESNGNRLEIEAGEIGLRMVSDPVRLKQILINLIGNAARFTKQGKVRLAVEVAAEEVRFVVRDNGSGMSPQQLSRLFEPFGQVDSSARQPYAGAGLGLAISKQLSQLLSGSLCVESEEGKGTTATLKLPRFQPSPTKGAVE